MKKHLIEIHAHTDESSNCGKMPAEQVVETYRSKGYSGIMITDHLHHYTFKRKLLVENPNATWDDKIDYFLRGYKLALKKAEEYDDFKVYLGAELRFDENDNDYLIFGLSEKLLRSLKDLYTLEYEDGLTLLREKGCTIIQAHPFRNNCTVIDPKLLDGIEIHNAHPNHDSRNDIAVIWADKYDFKIRTGGTDFHGDVPPLSGIYVDKIPENEKELQNLIINCDFEIKM